MTKLWIGNGQLVLPDRILSGGSVLVEQGRITAVDLPCPSDAEVVDAHGGYILPGFVDIHVHGGGGGDFMDCEADSFRQAARTHCAHGTTALCPTTMTCEDSLLEKVIDLFREVKSQPQDGAELLGLHLEGPFFSAASKGAQPISRQRLPTEEMLNRILDRAQGTILRWDAAPELDHIDVFAQVMRKRGVMASAAHTNATATQALQAYDWGFQHVTHFYNATSTFHKVNGIVHSGVIEATYLRDDVTIELIGDGRHIPRESMLLACRIKGPDKICLITDAMRAAGTHDTRSILGARDTGVPVVVKDDVAQLTDLSSYAGSVATMDRCLRTAHVSYGIPLVDVSKMLSLTPARLMGCADRIGSLALGKDGDIVVMTTDFQVEQVFVKGRRFSK